LINGAILIINRADSAKVNRQFKTVSSKL